MDHYSLKRYLKTVVDAHDENYPHLRWGQAYFNELTKTAPNLALMVTKTEGVDPYYDDKKIGAFLDFIHERWGMYD